MLKTQTFQEAGLLREDFCLDFLTVLLDAVLCSFILRLSLRFLCVGGGGGFVRVGGGLVEVQGRAQGESLVAAVADEPVELADAPAEVCLTPDLSGRRAPLRN